MYTLDQLCKDISEYTENNDHTTALLDIAFYFDYMNFILSFQAISHIQDAEGFLPPEISDYRNRKHNELFSLIESEHGDKVAQQIKKCL